MIRARHFLWPSIAAVTFVVALVLAVERAVWAALIVGVLALPQFARLGALIYARVRQSRRVA